MKRAILTTSAAALLGVSGATFAASDSNDDSTIDLDEFDNADLVDNWRATAILGGDVVGEDGNRVGSVHEMIIGEDGLIQSVVVTRNTDATLDQDYLTVEWSKVRFQPDESRAKLLFSKDEATDRNWADLPPIAGVGEWKTSRMIGMDVDSTDDVPEGEVEDILFTEGAEDMNAFVIESPLDDEIYYALPGDPEFVDYEEGELDLPYTAKAIEDLPELDY